ncbi:MAG: DUF4175 family protein [Rhodospirillales bacterium]|nr:DUF4175 family protein [Rhodospirillales bacterium]
MSRARGLGYRLLVRLAAASLAWEALWPRLWPAVTLIGAGLALALLDVLPLLPAWLHAGVLIVFAAALLAALAWAGTGLRRIDRHQALRRIEQDSALSHRPLSALEDRQGAGADDPLARLLWQRHQADLHAARPQLRLKLPAPGVARLEPWGLRAAVLLLLVIAVAAGGRQAPERLARAVQPALGSGAVQPRVELWITPPAYTGHAPLFLKAGATAEGQGGAGHAAPAPASIPVPDGSVAVVRATGISSAPTLVLADQRTPMTAIGAEQGGSGGAFTASVVIRDGRSLSVDADGRIIAHWPLTPIADQPPAISLSRPPESTPGGSLDLAYTAHDDYPLRAITAIITPGSEPGAELAAKSDTTPAAESSLRVPLPLGAGSAGAITGRKQIDLADHPRAGQPGSIVLEAEDAAGQTTRSETVTLTLPERTFTHPVAQALIALRKRLITAGEAARGDVAEGIAEIAGRPDDFAGDVVVALALAVGHGRLVHDRASAAIATVADLLWQAAVRLDEGEVPLALRAFEDARERLEAALRDQAPLDEIERLIDALQEALDAYLAAVVNELVRQGDGGLLTAEGSTMVHTADLFDLLDLARRLARAGAREGAQQLLADLQELLADIRAGMQMSEQRKRAREVQALLEEVRGVTVQQQELLQETFGRELRERSRHGSGRGATSADAAAVDRQNAVRQELGALIGRAAELLERVPPPLPEADQAMGSAAGALRSGRFGDAVNEQTHAVDALKRATDSVANALSERLSGIPGLLGAEGSGSGRGQGDLFGRGPAGGRRGFARGHVQIPEEAGLHRAQELLDELRRRASDQRRGPQELDYIERLLRQF